MRKLLAIAAAAGALLAAHAALAQTAPVLTQKDVYVAVLQPVLMAVGSAAAVLITGLAAYALQWLRQRTGLTALELDAQHRDALQAALTNAAGAALNALGNKLDGKVVDVSNPAVQKAVEYVVKAAPGALQHFGLQNKLDDVAEKIVAKLPQIANTTTPVT